MRKVHVVREAPTGAVEVGYYDDQDRFQKVTSFRDGNAMDRALKYLEVVNSWQYQ